MSTYWIGIPEEAASDAGARMRNGLPLHGTRRKEWAVQLKEQSLVMQEEPERMA